MLLSRRESNCFGDTWWSFVIFELSYHALATLECLPIHLGSIWTCSLTCNPNLHQVYVSEWSPLTTLEMINHLRINIGCYCSLVLSRSIEYQFYIVVFSKRQFTYLLWQWVEGKQWTDMHLRPCGLTHPQSAPSQSMSNKKPWLYIYIMIHCCRNKFSTNLFRMFHHWVVLALQLHCRSDWEQYMSNMFWAYEVTRLCADPVVPLRPHILCQGDWFQLLFYNEMRICSFWYMHWYSWVRSPKMGVRGQCVTRHMSIHEKKARFGGSVGAAPCPYCRQKISSQTLNIVLQNVITNILSLQQTLEKVDVDKVSFCNGYLQAHTRCHILESELQESTQLKEVSPTIPLPWWNLAKEWGGRSKPYHPLKP